MNKHLNDSHGNKSSKRLWRSILFSIGILFSIITFSIAIGIKDSTTALKIIEIFFSHARF